MCAGWCDRVLPTELIRQQGSGDLRGHDWVAGEVESGLGTLQTAGIRIVCAGSIRGSAVDTNVKGPCDAIDSMGVPCIEARRPAATGSLDHSAEARAAGAVKLSMHVVKRCLLSLCCREVAAVCQRSAQVVRSEHLYKQARILSKMCGCSRIAIWRKVRKQAERSMHHASSSAAMVVQQAS